jgi:Glycosyltransferase 61
MVSLQYKGRIHKAKFTMRSLRYVFSDQAARAIPALQRRWLLPIESQPVASAAVEDFPISSATVETPYPACLTELGIAFPRPLHLTDHVYSLEDTIVTGWAGAMIMDGLFLANRPQPNWVSAFRARPHRLRMLSGERAYVNLMAPIPARGHIFHWLFDAILPLIAFLEARGGAANLGLIVNAVRGEFQEITLAYLKARYDLTAIEPLAQHEAVRVPHLKANIPVPHIPRALQSPAGLSALDDLARFIEADSPEKDSPRRLYISRNDARLRRVSNEDGLLPLLEERGFQRLTLRGLPIARQVQLFRRAEAIVAPHGAGLAHSAWCKPGTKIVEFFPSPGGPLGRVKNASADMWLIAMQRGLAHRCYLAGPLETRSDAFSIPARLLIEALDLAGLSVMDRKKSLA